MTLQRLERILIQTIVPMILAIVPMLAGAQPLIDYEVTAFCNGGKGDFAPYYIASNRHGTLTQRNNAFIGISATKGIDYNRRFDYGFGIEALNGYSSTNVYGYYDAEKGEWESHRLRPATSWLQQAYGELKYRGVFVVAGLKEVEPMMVNFDLSSGDLVESGNARPIPQVRCGFVEFQDIPFTRGWVQIEGVLSYGRYADGWWNRSHYNYYNWHINSGAWYTYKRCHFRTNPRQPIVVTAGMQVAGSFGGTTSFYRNGKLIEQMKFSTSLKTIMKMFIPTRNEGSDYYTGSTLGSWDVGVDVKLGRGNRARFYVEKPFEDGSGIGWLNGFDGLWGLEMDFAGEKSGVSGAVVEYFEMNNQSGPIHWSPDDSPGTTITDHSTGGDEYYNNNQYNSYMNYGMSIGTPFLRSPLYNLDGYLRYVDNRVRGFHAGVKGWLGRNLGYRMLMSYRKGWGDGRLPTVASREDYSLLVEGIYEFERIKGLSVKAQLGVDSGSMYGDQTGGMVSVSYRGSFNIKR